MDERKEVPQPQGLETKEVGQNTGRAQGADAHAGATQKLAIVLPSAATLLSWLDKIAIMAHEANRLWQVLHGDPVISPTWTHAGREQQESTREGVLRIMSGEITTPEQAHESWLSSKIANGWTYGDVKDVNAKTHPCMVGYAALPIEQRAKDAIFFGVVEGLVRIATNDGGAASR